MFSVDSLPSGRSLPVAGVPSRPEYFESESVGRQQGGARRLSIERPIPIFICLFGLTAEGRVLYISRMRCRRKKARLTGRGPVNWKLGPRSLPYWVCL